ncbi:TRAFs-binding domain-containing protein [Algoriphagus sp.]|uniref:TRAFs-binding domain-containing protein n=1 Tax=Algoriphagus sp. TaxID=1872435 RepID=UPI0025EBFEA6|nr:TRAFs-binding domain-containing protein [Algoriphagus sp.]
MKPLCFVIMPFGKKPDSSGRTINFDEVYEKFIKPVIEESGLESIRADQEMMGGIIHKPMYERLILCDFAIADLTTANANVFYELGIRYTAKPFTTFSIFETGTKIPFDLVDVRCFPYTIVDNEIVDLEEKKEALKAYIAGIKKKKITDSPVYQLMDGIEFKHNLSIDKVDMLRERAEHDNKINEQIKEILNLGKEEDRLGKLETLEKSLPEKDDWDAGLAIDFMLAYRSINGFQEMVNFIESLPNHLKGTIVVQEQYGFALNRAGKKDKAIEVLNKLVEEKGGNGETLGILGRIYKDKYNEAKASKPFLAKGFLDKAISIYTEGYQADLRDFYPGINAATLKFVRGDKDTIDFAKVVEYSVLTYLEKKSKIPFRKAPSDFEDYWPQATLLELALLQNDQDKAFQYLTTTISTPHEDWQTDSTAKNLELYKVQGDWVAEVIQVLLDK